MINLNYEYIDILETIECKSLSWYGHMQWLDDERWPKINNQMVPVHRTQKEKKQTKEDLEHRSET